MAKTKKGLDIKEYPKLVKNAEGRKVRVLNEAEEKEVTKDTKKAAAWGDKDK